MSEIWVETVSGKCNRLGLHVELSTAAAGQYGRKKSWIQQTRIDIILPGKGAHLGTFIPKKSHYLVRLSVFFMLLHCKLGYKTRISQYEGTFMNIRGLMQWHYVYPDV